jgi:hypothetical protein
MQPPASLRRLLPLRHHTSLQGRTRQQYTGHVCDRIPSIVYGRYPYSTIAMQWCAYMITALGATSALHHHAIFQRCRANKPYAAAVKDQAMVDPSLFFTRAESHFLAEVAPTIPRPMFSRIPDKHIVLKVINTYSQHIFPCVAHNQASCDRNATASCNTAVA